ncbi:MAG: pullulanase-associated domain-containing protein, partial [Acholeplasmataceae bacterium]
MKKVLLSLFLGILAFAVIGTTIYASEEGTGNLVVHFQSWEADYEGLGSHGWGGAEGKPYDGEDDFGVYFEYDDIALGGGDIGFIAVYWEDGGPNWDRKLTGDVLIDSGVLVEGETVHVYVFEGAATTDDDPGYYVADNDMPNMLLVYYDPSGAYEEELGVHAWNWQDYGSE